MKKWFEIKAAAGVGEISIYDEIGAWGITAKAFSDELKALGAVSRINLSINSPGGSVFDGIAIFNMLKRHKASITVRVDGIAASIASAIAMAGDTILMPENSMMLIHNPSSIVVDGEADELRALAEALDKIKESMVSIYASRTSLDPAEIETIMTNETWLSAAEAVEKGFADKLEAAMKAAAHFDLKGRFENVPAALASFVPVDIAAQAAAKRESDITAACSIARKPDKAAQFIASDKSLSDVVAALRAERPTTEEISTRHSTANADKAGGWEKVIARVNKRVEARMG